MKRSKHISQHVKRLLTACMHRLTQGHWDRAQQAKQVFPFCFASARAAAFVSAPQPEGTTQRLSCQLHHQKGTTTNAPPSSVAPTHHTKAAQLLCMRVRVSAVWQDAWVIPMHDVVDLVFCEQLIDEVWGQVVGHVCADMHKQMHTRSGMTQEDESFQPLWVKKFACCTRHPCISAPAQGFRGIFYCCELMKAIESNFF